MRFMEHSFGSFAAAGFRGAADGSGSKTARRQGAPVPEAPPRQDRKEAARGQHEAEGGLEIETGIARRSRACRQRQRFAACQRAEEDASRAPAMVSTTRPGGQWRRSRLPNPRWAAGLALARSWPRSCGPMGRGDQPQRRMRHEAHTGQRIRRSAARVAGSSTGRSAAW